MSLTFLHTSPVHVNTFNTLLAELAPDIPTHHLVDESLLNEARERGAVTDQLQQRIQETLRSIIDQGASVVVCTCSTIGGAVEDFDQQTSTTVMRIDRPMAEEAVARGSRIIVAAALSTTLLPTRELILSAARRARKEVQIIDLLCDTAWHQFELGNHTAYLQEIADQLQQAASQGDVIVLAQASMAGATQLCPDLPIPVLTSPQSGLEAAIQSYRQNVARRVGNGSQQHDLQQGIRTVLCDPAVSTLCPIKHWP